MNFLILETYSNIKIKKSNMSIKIYEMLMRDGLQSLSKVYSLNDKLKLMNLLNQCNFHCVEFGSTTSAKLLPQMANSFELFENMNKKTNTKYTMLVPGYNHTQKAIENGVKSFGLVCSVSEIFAQKNLKKTSQDTVKNVFNQMDLITNMESPYHIRVYLSCSFGSPWEDFNKIYLNNLENYVREFINYGKIKKISPENLDIVISDTVGLSTQKRTEEILKMLDSNIMSKDKDYLAAHIHCKDNNFYSLIEDCIKNRIEKFDSSMVGIGGCPFAEDDALGNISTIKLIEFLSVHYNYYSKEELDKVKYIETKVKKILNNY